MDRRVNAMPTVAASSRAAKPRPLERRVQRILEIVEAGTTYAVRDLAAEFHLSPSYLQRLFKNQTGVCMGEWLSEHRLSRAAQLLSGSYLSIKEISHAVGYEHTSSFVRAFERRFLQPPARYRKHSHSHCSGAPLERNEAA